MVTPFETQESAPQKESREMREAFPLDAQAEAAAAMERAEYIVKDVQSSAQQMKHIIMNMHAVKQQIQELRRALQLAETGDDASLIQDKARVEDLKKKIAAHQQELIGMRSQLIREQQEDLLAKGATGDTAQQATGMIDTMIADVLKESNA